MNWLTQDDPHCLILSFLYVVAVIAVAEGVRRIWRLPPDVSRKMVHVLVAAWALPTAVLFESALWAAAMPLVFVLLNFFSYRYRIMDLIEEEGRGSPGTIYFPLSFAALILVFWGWEGGRAASVAGLYAMGFGDAAASVLGRRFGRRRVLPGGKSLEGSAAMFFFSWPAVALGSWFLLGTPAWIPSALAALGATVAEAPAARGTDNLSVPVTGAAVFLLAWRFLG